MSRPTSMKVGRVVYWTLMTYDDSGVLIDADSTPVVDIRKNGASILDVATSSKRSGRTGIYDYAYNPAGEVEGDTFSFEETATISGQAYVNSWSLEVDALMSTAPTVADIVDGVWDETTASHNTVGTFGYEINNSVAPPTAGDIADAVWDEPVASHTTINTFGNTVVTLPSSAEIADDVWDETDFLHVNANSFGKRLYDLSTADETADAVWDSVKFNHQTTNTFGEILNNVGTGGGGGDATLANQTQLLADIAALNDFDPTLDTVARVTLVDTTTVNTDMRGTDGANTVTPNTVAPDNASIAAILVDTADLQANQGQWLTATGFSTFDSSVDTVTTDTASRDASKADVSGLSTFDPASDQVVASNMRGTDGANTVTPNTVAPDNASIAAILLDTADLQANQGQWLTANVSGLASQASVDVLDANVDTLIANQGDWATADVSGLLTASGYNASLPANFSTLIIGTGVDAGKVTTSNPAAGSGSSHTAQDVANLILAVPSVPIGNTATGSIALVDTTTDVTNQSAGGTNPADIYAYFTAGSNEDAFKADVSGLSTFNHAVDQVTASNMRGTDGANTVVPVDVSADVAAILADTADLQANQGQWITATGFNTVAPDNASISAILADTADLQANQGQWLTATGFSTFDPATDSVITDAASRNASKADVSGLSTFDSTTDQVVASNMRGTDSAILATSAPANWPLMIVDGTGKVTTSNPAAGGGSAHTAADVRDLILAGDKTPITMASNKVSNVALVDTTTDLTNGGSGGGDDAATIYNYFTAGSNEDVFKADVSALATSANLEGVANVTLATNTAVNALNDITAADVWNYTDVNGVLPKSAQLQANYQFNINIETVTDKIDNMLVLNGEGTEYQYTVDALENGPTGGGGGSCPTAQEIVDTWGNQPQGVYTTSGTLGFYLDAQVSTAGSGGAGLYQATVRVQDTSNNALQGARVNVDGTTLTLTTDSSGEVTFNLDSGVYLLEISPPAGYDTPVGQVLTVSTSDPADTVFTLTATSPPTGCSTPWVG